MSPDWGRLVTWAENLPPEIAGARNGDPSITAEIWERILADGPSIELLNYQAILGEYISGSAREKILGDLETLTALNDISLDPTPSPSKNLPLDKEGGLSLLRLEVDRALLGTVDARMAVKALEWILSFDDRDGLFGRGSMFGDIWYLTILHLNEDLTQGKGSEELLELLRIVRRDRRLFQSE